MQLILDLVIGLLLAFYKAFIAAGDVSVFSKLKKRLIEDFFQFSFIAKIKLKVSSVLQVKWKLLSKKLFL